MKLAKIDTDQKKEIFLFGLAFSFFIYMAMTKLTQAPLWLDETLEYYISRSLTGPLSWYSNNGVTVTNNMYERMLGAFQPPLYNIVMYFWLLISTGEWWFRFSSVIMSAIGVIGIYQSIRKITTIKIASLSVVVYSCIYQVIYYTQECGEYAMLLMFLPWLLYSYIKLMEHRQLKNMIFFALFCVLSIYTQYGAAFVILPLAMSVGIRILQSKEWNRLKQLICVYLITFLVAAIPLLIFFIIPQLQNQTTFGPGSAAWRFYQNNFFLDFIHMFIDVFRWNTIESITRFYGVALIITILLGLMAFACFTRSRSILLKHLILCNIATWILYYIPTRAGIYGRGYFGFRYNLFFIPLWLLTIALMLFESYQILGQISKTEKKRWLQRGYCMILLIAIAGYCVYGTHQINKRWEKSDTRGCVNTWYAEQGYDTLTYVDWGQTPSFSYYLEHDDRYQANYENNLIREKLEKPEIEDVHLMLDGKWPEEIYCCVGDIHTSAFVQAFVEKGYTVEQLYKTTAQLYYIHR
ncbi:MAG: glycosyltransferase family 39 protein [Lachnospiraceae bacterium]